MAQTRYFWFSLFICLFVCLHGFWLRDWHSSISFPLSKIYVSLLFSNSNSLRGTTASWEGLHHLRLTFLWKCRLVRLDRRILYSTPTVHRETGGRIFFKQTSVSASQVSIALHFFLVLFVFWPLCHKALVLVVTVLVGAFSAADLFVSWMLCHHED